MSDRDSKGSGVSLLDTGLVVAGVVGAVLVVLWLAHAVLGLALFVFKVAVLVIVVAVALRVVHRLTRGGT